MFLGSYKVYFSGKNRIILPKKFRQELGNEDKFYLVKGIDGEIWGFNLNEWQKEVKNRLSLPLIELSGRLERRKFFSNAEECDLDSQGRFIISGELINYSEIKNEVLLIGAGDHFEIWNPKLWDKIMSRVI